MALNTVLALPQPSRNGISVLLTDDEEIQLLNKSWRNQNKATDVLSWPAPDIPGNHLGDIAISIETAQRQAKERKVSLSNEVTMLLIHGALHLLGFDDITETEYEEMQVRMREVALMAGLSMKGDWGSFGEPS